MCFAMSSIEENNMSSSEDEFKPLDIVEAAKNVTAPSLPAKSREKYESVYEKFREWKTTKNFTSFSETVLLTYFTELSANVKPSTLWAQFSMLKSTINANNNVDIGTYTKLSAFLKKQATGYKGKKTKVLTSNDVEKFLNKAPDEIYLATKVALILAVTGACRRDELCNMTTRDINDNGSMALIIIPRTQSNVQRSFTVVGEFYRIFKKYALLRPKNTSTDRFFMNYRNGECTQQVIGINKFGSMPKQIATYLKLPDPQSYTAHSFRQTSAMLLADTGADPTTLKRHGGWRCNQIGYAEDSLDKKIKICQQITESVHLQPTTFAAIDIKEEPIEDDTLEVSPLDVRRDLDDALEVPPLRIRKAPDNTLEVPPLRIRKDLNNTLGVPPLKIRNTLDSNELRINWGPSSSKNNSDPSATKSITLTFNQCSNSNISINFVVKNGDIELGNVDVTK